MQPSPFIRYLYESDTNQSRIKDARISVMLLFTRSKTMENLMKSVIMYLFGVPVFIIVLYNLFF